MSHSMHKSEDFACFPVNFRFTVFFGEFGHAARLLSLRPAEYYIQLRAIRYRPHTTTKATIVQSTATNQKGIALRPLLSHCVRVPKTSLPRRAPLVTWE